MAKQGSDSDVKALTEKASTLSEKLADIRGELGKVIVGQERVLSRLQMGLLCDGHVLLEGLPGLAKTLMVQTLASVTDCGFKRIQFTPDLLPADIVGTKIYNQKTMEFQTARGPIFTNFLLADEVNRAPPKVQSALLEAMQERQVSIGGDTLKLPRPFFVLATQNPIEVEGTYPLPEAQVDRFMFKVVVGYPTKDEEVSIMERMAGASVLETDVVLSPKEIDVMQEFTKQIYVDGKIREYVADLVNATRSPKESGLPEIKPYVLYGASPRASIFLIKASKANAILEGRGYVTPDDVKAVFHDVLRHRLILTYEAEAEEKTAEGILDSVIARIKSP